MKNSRFQPLLRRGRNCLFLATLTLVSAQAQSVPAGTSQPPTSGVSKAAAEEAITLNPFEVSTARDTSYGALNSNSITRFNTELAKVPVSADVFTDEFMKDVGATSVEQLLLDYGAGVGTADPAADSDAANNQPGDRVSNQRISVRGVMASNVKVDGFESSPTMAGNTDSAFIERVEVIRGPQGLLYGASGAGGTINTISKRARFNDNSGSISLRVDQYGTKRSLLDYNWGKRWFAYRLSLLDSEEQTRRVFVGNHTKGIYAQLAFRLPLNTIVRVQGQVEKSDRVNATAQNNLNFGGTSHDPRHLDSLSYLLATHQAGSTDPVTGATFPFGAIANGGLTWDNLNSWAGARNHEFWDTNAWTLIADTVWTKWLSSQFGFRYNDAKSDYITSGIVNLTPPLTAGNPLNSWANAAPPRDIEQPTRRWSMRGSFLLDNHLWGRLAHSQTAAGYDADWWQMGSREHSYYLADANGNVIYNPALSSNLGRTVAGNQWWAVGSSPVLYGDDVPGWDNPRIMIDGQTYVRMAQNPVSPQWVSANNPLGLASLAGFPGVAGQNALRKVDNRTIGVYGTNYTSWFDDKFSTLLGWRTTRTYLRTPNTSASETRAYDISRSTNPSVNAGVDYAVLNWLRAYYSYSSTFNTPLVSGTDPLGNPAPTSSAVGNEVGFKFSPRSGLISGSIDYYWTSSKSEQINAGSGLRDLVNPTGLNGSAIGPGGGKNQWVPVDRKTSGTEIILTAAPTTQWRLRFAAAVSDGVIESDKIYPLLYNDEFYMTSSGNVTYQDGSPFLIPLDPSTITNVIGRLSRQTDPQTLAGYANWVPLTRAMINDPSNPYYATPADDNGRLLASNLRRVLQYFVAAGHGSARTGRTGLPISAMQYNWADPNNTGGTVVAVAKGEKTVGYPVYKLSLTNSYTIAGDNFLKGLTIGGTVLAGFKNRTYYYASPDKIRRLYSSPDLVLVNGMLSYRRGIFRHYVWTTQLNVTNVFNHYRVELLPANGSGFTNPADINATFYGQPRLWVWTNTISF